MQNIKLVVVGDELVGKTCLLISYTTNSFPSEYIPKVFDNYSPGVMTNTNPIQLGLWDTACDQQYDRLRPLSYPQTDIFLICYAVNDISSLQSIPKWIDETQHHVPNAPFIIIGLKSDLRHEYEDFPILFVDKDMKQLIVNKYIASYSILSLDVIELLLKYVPSLPGLVRFEDVERLAKDYGANDCMECSALTQANLKNVFDRATAIVIAGHRKKSVKKRKNCCVL